MQSQPSLDGPPPPDVAGEANPPDLSAAPAPVFKRIWRTLWAPALCCVAVGMLMSLLPLLIPLTKGQRPVWIADSDELLYLSIASQAYFSNPFHLSDPIVPGHAGRSMFPWIQFAPGILPAYFLHLGPLAISFF